MTCQIQSFYFGFKSFFIVDGILPSYFHSDTYKEVQSRFGTGHKEGKIIYFIPPFILKGNGFWLYLLNSCFKVYFYRSGLNFLEKGNQVHLLRSNQPGTAVRQRNVGVYVT